ncbi:hypothetical protein ACRAWF_22765 [Streptomyces sp. L7]
MVGQATARRPRTSWTSRKVANNVLAKPQKQAQASTGSFTTRCGVNANKNHNTDNVIVAPGVTNGAHHEHDYVGNQKVNAFSTNDSLLAAPPAAAEPERPLGLLLAGRACAGRLAGVRRERARRWQGRQRRQDPDPAVGADQVRRLACQQGRRDAAVPAHHHR